MASSITERASNLLKITVKAKKFKRSGHNMVIATARISAGRSNLLFFTAFGCISCPAPLVFTRNLCAACLGGSSTAPQMYDSVRNCLKKLGSATTTELPPASKPMVFLGAVLRKSKKHQAISPFTIKLTTLPSKPKHSASIFRHSWLVLKSLQGCRQSSTY